jgi:uncharacterized protein
MTTHSKHVIFLLSALFVLVSILTAVHLFGNFGKSLHETASITLSDGAELEVEVARTLPERIKGLSDRANIGQYDGMLFIHPNTDTHSYWMKDMNFDIDIVWILDDAIVDISKNLEPEEPAETLYSPKTAANTVLELKAGEADNLGLTTGQKLDIKFSGE